MLIFNNPSDINQFVITLINTLESLYNGKYGTKIGWGKDISLRPANKCELESEGILG